MRTIETVSDFLHVAMEEIFKRGIELQNTDDCILVRIVQFRSDKPSYTLSFTDADGNDYNGNGHSPEVAIKSAIASAKPVDIKI